MNSWDSILCRRWFTWYIIILLACVLIQCYIGSCYLNRQQCNNCVTVRQKIYWHCEMRVTKKMQHLPHEYWVAHWPHWVPPLVLHHLVLHSCWLVPILNENKPSRMISSWLVGGTAIWSKCKCCHICKGLTPCLVASTFARMSPPPCIASPGDSILPICS